MHGTVVVGLKQARSLGYPTINLSYESTLSVPSGVYSASVTTDDGIFVGAAVVGGDFIESSSPKLEIHLLGDTKTSRYGERVEIKIGERVSDVQRISDMDLLRKKIETDIEQVRMINA